MDRNKLEFNLVTKVASNLCRDSRAFKALYLLGRLNLDRAEQLRNEGDLKGFNRNFEIAEDYVDRARTKLKSLENRGIVSEEKGKLLSRKLIELDNRLYSNDNVSALPADDGGVDRFIAYAGQAKYGSTN